MIISTMSFTTRFRRDAYAAARSMGRLVRSPMAGPGLPAEASAAAIPESDPPVRWWSTFAPWLMLSVVALAFYLAWFTYDQLQNRLLDSSRKFESTVERFDRFWSHQEAAVESTLAIAWARPAPTGAPDPEAFGSAVRRFTRDAATLHEDLSQPQDSPEVDATGYDRAVAALSGTLARVSASLGAPASVPAEPGAPGPADLGVLERRQVQAVLQGLAALAQDARRQQTHAAEFRAEVDDARRQVLLAFSGIVAMLVLAAAMAVQWVVVARRERVIRDRAEHLAEVAEAERARAENVMRDKSRFLGMLSHELLTPLQSIWSTMDVIESRGRVDAREAAFTRLRDSTRSLSGRISDLVDFAKMSSGRLETRIRGFQLDKLVDAALRDLEEELAERNLDVHWEAGPEQAERIFSDPARLRQILDNILTNAVKYTERGGIAIHARIDHGAGILRIEVSDTGIGIPADELGRLFEPFYRAPATAGMAQGSGLGLAVVRSLVDLMGGSIRYASVVGQGTTVTLEVPIAEADDGAVEVPLRLDLGKPVLVVDDARDARRAMADVIRALGLEVYEASGGVTGLAEASKRDYLAILLDMQMPDLSGYDVARRLRRPGGRHEKTFLVLVSAYSDLDQEAADAVFDARIDKPASRHDLVATLAHAAHGAQ